MLHTVVLIGLLGVILWLAAQPARAGWKLVLHAAGGLGSLIVLNLLSPMTRMLFELNIFTAAVAGGLGLPGVGALLVAHFILSH